jgi:hypothetical protein
MALGYNHPKTEICTRKIKKKKKKKKKKLGVKCGWRVGLTTLPPSLLAVCLSNVGALTSRNPMGLHGLEQGYLYLFN